MPTNAPIIRAMPTATSPTATAPAAGARASGNDQGETAPAAVREGATLFDSLGCAGCHRVDGSAGGFDLSNEGALGRSWEWLATQIREPAGHLPGSVMPAHPQLAEPQLAALVAYLQSLRKAPAAAPPAQPAPGGAAQRSPQDAVGRAAEIVGSAIHGAILYTKQCAACHGEAGRSELADSRSGAVPPLVPISRALFSPDPGIFAVHLDRLLQHGAGAAAGHPGVEMPAFGDTDALTQQQIADIEAYVMSLNGVARGGIQHPGIRPQWFAGIVATLFGATGLALGVRAGLRTRRRPPESDPR